MGFGDAKGMFPRDKRIGPYSYVYLVENLRENGRTKQRIIANLGRREVVDPAIDQGRNPGRVITAVFEPAQPFE